jgi:antitoxin CptB
MKDLDLLKWRCRRGMKELEVILIRYLEQNYTPASAAEQQAFVTLLELPDIEIYAYLVGQRFPAETEQSALVAKIRQLLWPST